MSARSSKLQREIAAYEAKKAQLIEDGHRDEYVLIKGDDVIGFFASEEDGLESAYEKFVDEPFLLRRIEESTTPIFFSAMVFANTSNM